LKQAATGHTRARVMTGLHRFEAVHRHTEGDAGALPAFTTICKKTDSLPDSLDSAVRVPLFDCLQKIHGAYATLREAAPEKRFRNNNAPLFNASSTGIKYVCHSIWIP
jgi:hypothetical protein